MTETINLKYMALSSTASACGEEVAGRSRKTAVKPAPAKQAVSLVPVQAGMSQCDGTEVMDYSMAYRALSIEERKTLALSATLDPGFRPYLVRDQWSLVKIYFGRRADLVLAEIALLIKDPDQTVRITCARREDLEPEQVARCVEDRDPNLRYFIARNVLLTEAQRSQLLADVDPLVRKAAAKGPKSRRIEARPGQAAMIR